MPPEKKSIDPGELETTVENSINKWQCQRATLINQEDGITSQGDAPVQENLGCDEPTIDQTKNLVRRSLRNRKLRSKSCSEITSLQPHKEPRCVKTIVEEDSDIDIDEGNELVEMLKTRLTLRSPKLVLQSPALDKIVSPEPSPSKSIFSPTSIKSNTSHQSEATSCHPHSDINPALSAIIQGYQSTISQILSVADDRYEKILNIQQQQLEQFQKQQQEQFSYFQQQIMQQHQFYQQQIHIPPLPTPEVTSPSPTIIYEEISNPAGAGNQETLKKRKSGKKKNAVKSQDSPKQPQQKQHANQKQCEQQHTQMPSCSSNTSNITNSEVLPNMTPPLTSPTPSIIRPGSSPIISREPKMETKSVMVLGSSIVKHVGGRNIHEYSGYKAKVCCYPGAGIKKLADHTDVELKYAKPEVAILHVGGNDLANHLEVDEIADNIAYLGLQMIERGVKTIAVSGMTPRKNLIKEIPMLNKALQSMCNTYGFDFINNSNIKFGYKGWDGQPKSHLSWDRIHLNHSGVELLEDNYIYYLRDLKIVDEN